VNQAEWERSHAREEKGVEMGKGSWDRRVRAVEFSERTQQVPLCGQCAQTHGEFSSRIP
jgi:hypothetical protein